MLMTLATVSAAVGAILFIWGSMIKSAGYRRSDAVDAIAPGGFLLAFFSLVVIIILGLIDAFRGA